ncbi:hypothetical protein K2173_026982 [Erythroxylum novogranatense]|uniref:PX domain-containing protein n=1 Tax=Erythroxylum novogranatense TaxID=1862640 RepID=A0AAV8TXU5_9ROSI|nr:hypothetical protein K2173_026982 [Erythroxylum novogranatense]
MNNEEDTRESVSGPVSPDTSEPLPPRSLGGDASPGSLSQYSSCGESEFERYYSANSVMGTASSCSSIGPFNDLPESEFGSLKSLENFSLEQTFDGGPDERTLSNSVMDSLKGHVKEGFRARGRSGLESSANKGTSGLVNGLAVREDENFNIGEGERGSIDCGPETGLNFGKGSREGSLDRVVNVNEDIDCCLSGMCSDLSLEFHGGEVEEEDGGSSRYEHSEGDDSMYGCGSDDENRNLCFQRSADFNEQAKIEYDNPLLLNSSVAFGSDDWDDFEKETWGGTLASLNSNILQEQKQEDLETEEKNIGSTSMKSKFSIADHTEKGIDLVEEYEGSSQVGCGKLKACISCSAVPTDHQHSQTEEAEEIGDIILTNCHVEGVNELTIGDAGASVTTTVQYPPELDEDNAIDFCVPINHIQTANDTTEPSKFCSLSDGFEMKQDPLALNAPKDSGLKIMDSCVKSGCPPAESQENIHQYCQKKKEVEETKNLEADSDPLSDTTGRLGFHPSNCYGNANPEFFENLNPEPMQQRDENNAGNDEHHEFYDEIVNEMEEILLDSADSVGAWFPQYDNIIQSHLSLPLRDGGSTASTSGTDDTYPVGTQQRQIDGVEVVGAKQKRGDVSLSERLVGVKEYTVYIIRVWSGQDQWEVERRYRDFYTLYRQLKSLFTDLPSPWSSVEKESRKLFGNASPDVVSERSVLIQECLQSILHSGRFSAPPSALVWFLSPDDSFPSSPASRKSFASATLTNIRGGSEKVTDLGKTISLIVENRPHRTLKQLLEAQHYSCAGCHKPFNDGMTLMRDLIQSIGWGKPRLCEYTGQLFCSSCHTNDTAVLPARVLHYWDFTQYPVSQLAKSYLDSIHEQPMLCVSAVNPFLFSRVPALQHVTGVRKRIGIMLPYVHCPFRQTINRGLGYRRYLLESNDFFALRDLIDLSKGPFAVLPVIVETVSGKILEHITEQCLICCDVGVPCNARQACNDPSSLIFPFQEGEVEKCASCGSVFHKTCFKLLKNCSCGACIAPDKLMEPTNVLRRKASDYLLGERSSSGLTGRFLSGLFSRAKPEKTTDYKDSDNVILMGSLPSTL